VAFLAALRSFLAVSAVVLWLAVPGNLMLFAGVVPAGWLMPRRRRAFVSAYMRLMSRGILGLIRLGGARFERSGTIPTDRPGLVIMNHQSLLDIPSLVLMSWPQSPAFVTRSRYGRFLAPVSTCVQMLGSPIIDPRRDPRAAVEQIGALAPSLQNGVVLFAEGHRSRDGGVRPFKSAGAQAILDAHPMPIWIVATDGLGSMRRLVDFLFHAQRMRSRTEVLGRIDAPPPGADVTELLAEVRRRIVDAIERMRAQPGLVPPAVAEAVRARSLSAGAHEGTRAAQALAEAAGGEVDAVVFFGSRKTGARPDPHSAVDFFVVVRDEKRFYRALRAAGLIGRRPGLLAALGRVLPPTSISLLLPGREGSVRSKSAVVSRRAFERDTSQARRDHFTLGRLFQPAEVV
jgi:1-acyl-sn-glycerol-3-phosphate acyltransferase